MAKRRRGPSVAAVTVVEPRVAQMVVEAALGRRIVELVRASGLLPKPRRKRPSEMKRRADGRRARKPARTRKPVAERHPAEVGGEE